MQKRNTQQRRRSILEQLNRTGEVAVDELAKLFSTSEVTIRKDFVELESNGLLLRKFGGAILLPTSCSELSDEKVSPRKKAMAAAAASLIKDHNRIIIDSGSSTAALLPELKHKMGLLVMTNSLQVANYLLERENEPKVLMTGGTWDTQSHSFQGKMAELVLKEYNFDQAFIGAAGLDPEKGTTTFNELTQLSQTMAVVSNQVIVMAESEKLHRKIPNVELLWRAISVLVTDEQIPTAIKQQIEQHGVDVICANTTNIGA
jgi:DeoR/GlpR family transcriptional regulator of sugar metabolism